jgi:protein TonB
MLYSIPMTAHYSGKSLSDTQAFGLSAAFHLSLVLTILLVMRLPKPEIEPAKPIEVRLVQAEKPVPTPSPVLQPPPKPQPVQKRSAKPLPAPSPIAPLSDPVAPSVAAAPTVSETTPAPFVNAKFDAAYLNNPKPPYPAAARRRGETGTVHLRVHVNEAGLAAEVEVKTSSGSGILDNTAKETVAKWKFVAARKGNAPVDSWVIVPIKFSLNDE